MTNNIDVKRSRATFLGASSSAVAAVVMLVMTLITPLSSVQAQVRDTDLPIGIPDPDDRDPGDDVSGSIFDCFEDFNPEFNAFWACLRAAIEPPE